MVYTSRYPVFYVTVDIVVLTIRDGALRALVVKRREEPFKERWALPGGFVHPDEDLADAAARELGEETSVSTGVTRLEQLASFGRPDRDPRGRIVSVAWMAVMPNAPDPTAGSDAAEAEWRPVDGLRRGRKLAFDHKEILEVAVERARAKLEYTTMAADFVEPDFTIADLRDVYEVMWGTELDAGNFHRKVTHTPGFVVRTGRTSQRGPGRPAALFRRGDAVELQPPLLRRGMTRRAGSS